MQDLRLLKNILESMAEFLALDVLMGWTKTENSVAYHFEKAGGIDALEETQKCSNQEIYHMAAQLVQNYFELENEVA
jgi:hypothetical protein